MIDFLSTEVTTTAGGYSATGKGSGTEISLADLTGGLFVIRYYIN